MRYQIPPEFEMPSFEHLISLDDVVVWWAKPYRKHCSCPQKHSMLFCPSYDTPSAFPTYKRHVSILALLTKPFYVVPRQVSFWHIVQLAPEAGLIKTRLRESYRQWGGSLSSAKFYQPPCLLGISVLYCVVMPCQSSSTLCSRKSTSKLSSFRHSVPSLWA